MSELHPPRFLVPLHGVNTFCTFREDKLVPENPLPSVGLGPHALDDARRTRLLDVRQIRTHSTYEQIHSGVEAGTEFDTVVVSIP